MIKITDAVTEIVIQNDYLRFGINKHILNLSRVAAVIRPLVEARTKKDIRISAILMQLSRLQRRMDIVAPRQEDVLLHHVSLRTDLISVTYEYSLQAFEKVRKLYTTTQKTKGYMTFTQGTDEITLIVDTSSFMHIRKMIRSKPKHVKKDLAAIEIAFDKKHADIPGLLYLVIQCVTLQNINISEISSTYTNLILYVDQKNARLAFDTVYNTFLSEQDWNTDFPPYVS